MKKGCLIIFIIFLVASPCIAAQYYVDNSCANNGDGSTTVCGAAGGSGPFNSIANMQAKGGGYSGGDVIAIKGGQTYNEQLSPPSSGTDATLRITINSYGGGPAIIKYGDPTLRTYGRSHIVFQNIIADGGSITADEGSADIVINYCVFKNSSSFGIFAYYATDVNVNNCTVAGSSFWGINYEGTSSGTIKNCLVVGNLGGVRKDLGATLTYANCLVTGNDYKSSSNFVGNPTDGGGNITTRTSEVTSPINGNVMWTIISDDHDVAYWDNIASTISPYNGKFTAFVWRDQITAGEETVIRNLAQAGHEMAVHGWSHTTLDCTTAFQVTSTNTNAAVNVDAANNQIILTCDEVTNRVTQTFAGNKTIADLRAAAAGKGWTITNSTNVLDGLKLYSLADSGGAQACPCTTNLDISVPNYAFWREEVSATKDWLASVTGVTPATIGYPSGLYTANLVTWVKDVCGLSGGMSFNGWLQRLNNVPIFALKMLDATTIKGDGTEAAIRSNVNHYVELGRQTGAVFNLYSPHDSKLTTTQIGWIADELFKHGIQFQTFSSVVSAIKADHATSDNLIFTKTYPDISDFRLRDTSPCIDAAADAGQTSDIIGNIKWGANWDIGAFEWSPSGSTSSIVPTTSSSTTSIIPMTTTAPETTTIIEETTTSIATTSVVESTTSIEPTTTTNVLPSTSTTTTIPTTTTVQPTTSISTSSIIPTTTSIATTSVVESTTSIELTTSTIKPDVDGDGIPDSEDNCPNTPNGPNIGTCMPGSDKAGEICHSDADCVNGCSSNGKCSMNQEDTDKDGVGDVCDCAPLDNTKFKNWTVYVDADGDGHGAGTAVTVCGGATVPSGYSTSNDDGCPNDPLKTAPGICGCGVPDTDTDGDGVPDCIDNCPNTPNGPLLGTCMPWSDKPGITCHSDADCANGCSSNGKCSLNQEDTNGDGRGDVCPSS